MYSAANNHLSNQPNHQQPSVSSTGDASANAQFSYNMAFQQPQSIHSTQVMHPRFQSLHTLIQPVDQAQQQTVDQRLITSPPLSQSTQSEQQSVMKSSQQSSHQVQPRSQLNTVTIDLCSPTPKASDSAQLYQLRNESLVKPVFHLLNQQSSPAGQSVLSQAPLPSSSSSSSHTHGLSGSSTVTSQSSPLQHPLTADVSRHPIVVCYPQAIRSTSRTNFNIAQVPTWAMTASNLPSNTIIHSSDVHTSPPNFVTQSSLTTRSLANPSVQPNVSEMKQNFLISLHPIFRQISEFIPSLSHPVRQQITARYNALKVSLDSWCATSRPSDQHRQVAAQAAEYRRQINLFIDTIQQMRTSQSHVQSSQQIVQSSSPSNSLAKAEPMHSYSHMNGHPHTEAHSIPSESRKSSKSDSKSKEKRPRDSEKDSEQAHSTPSESRKSSKSDSNSKEKRPRDSEKDSKRKKKKAKKESRHDDSDESSDLDHKTSKSKKSSKRSSKKDKSTKDSKLSKEEKRLIKQDKVNQSLVSFDVRPVPLSNNIRDLKSTQLVQSATANSFSEIEAERQKEKAEKAERKKQRRAAKAEAESEAKRLKIISHSPSKESMSYRSADWTDVFRYAKQSAHVQESTVIPVPEKINLNNEHSRIHLPDNHPSVFERTRLFNQFAFHADDIESVMRRVLPDDAAISADARNFITQAAAEFISLITDEAQDLAQLDVGRPTDDLAVPQSGDQISTSSVSLRQSEITSVHALDAMLSLGFDDYAVLSAYSVQKHRRRDDDVLSPKSTLRQRSGSVDGPTMPPLSGETLLQHAHLVDMNLFQPTIPRHPPTIISDDETNGHESDSDDALDLPISPVRMKPRPPRPPRRIEKPVVKHQAPAKSTGKAKKPDGRSKGKKTDRVKKTDAARSVVHQKAANKGWETRKSRGYVRGKKEALPKIEEADSDDDAQSVD